MYKDPKYPRIRFAVGTKRRGVSYALCCEKLKKLSSSLNDSESLEGNVPILVKTDELRAYDYRLERSYLIWLQRKDRCILDPIFEPLKATPVPFVDRIHDWTLEAKAFSDMWDCLQVCDTWKDLSEVSRLSLSLFPQLAAMSAASLLYGGLHLLAWNAPFHTPIHGLMWKISGIATASLGVILLLVFVAYLMLDFAQNNNERPVAWLMYVATALLCLGLLCITLLFVFARVYLVVESFPGLAYLPDSALITPTFSLYFPISDKWSGFTPGRLSSRSQGIPFRRFLSGCPRHPEK